MYLGSVSLHRKNRAQYFILYPAFQIVQKFGLSNVGFISYKNYFGDDSLYDSYTYITI